LVNLRVPLDQFQARPSAKHLQFAQRPAGLKEPRGGLVAAVLAQEPGQHPFAQQIITMQAKEAEAFAAKGSGNVDEVVAKMKEAVAIEDSIDGLSQPPYPIIPAHELFGTLLMELNRPADAMERFLQTLKRTPGRPKAIYGTARAAQARGDNATAKQRYQEFLSVWKNADRDRPEVVSAREFLAKTPAPAQQ
jgi:tetratricopeptide (TPR) repeat protein